MIFTKKQTKFITLILLAFVMISYIPMLRVQAIPLESTLGHNLQEEYWSVSYDFDGNYLEKDYNPGYLSDQKQEGLIDNNTNVDSIFYGAYTNAFNVQTLYIAMQNYSWGIDHFDESLYGCSPYQVLVQHFVPAGENKIHIVSINSFLGLLAYRDNATDGVKNLPDENDSLYLGWGFYSQFHKFLANLLFLTNGMPQWMYFDNSSKTIATPIPIEKNVDGNLTTYKYGMIYSNLFILWQKMEITEELGKESSLSGVDIIEKCSAFAMLDSLNFSFVISYNSSESTDVAKIKTTTEYKIGKTSELWVVGDSENVANYFGGDYFELNAGGENVDFAYYNETGVENRLTGNSTTEGFGLAVINTANLIVMDLSKIAVGNVGDYNFTDPQGSKILGDISQNVSIAQFNYDESPSFKLDFASKPKYTLNGITQYDAPTRILKNDVVKSDGGFLLQLYLNLLISGFISNYTKNALAGLHVLGNLGKPQFYYLTCFPVWSGGTIFQDPVFIAYVDTFPSNGEISGFNNVILSIIGLCFILILYKSNKRKIHKKI